MDGFCMVEDIRFVINDTHLFFVLYLNIKLWFICCWSGL